MSFFVPLQTQIKEKFMKKALLSICFAAISILCFAQNNEFSLKFNTRADFDYEYFDNNNINDRVGFAGKFLNIMLDGKINDKFEYHWRQRLNRTNFTSNFFGYPESLPARPAPEPAVRGCSGIRSPTAPADTAH